LYFEGQGQTSLFFGGYSDFLNHQDYRVPIHSSKQKKITEKIAKRQNKLSFKYKFELENIPKEILKLKEKIFEIKNELKDSKLYLSDHDRFTKITNDLAEAEFNLENKEIRWLELMEMKEQLEN